jgi:hypothetical protein
MTNKKEALLKLKERIQTQGIYPHEYLTKLETGECRYCAVGHLMQICGINVGTLVENSQNSSRITSISKELIQPLIDQGFDYSELNQIQKYNDSLEVNKLDKLYNYIDKLSAQEQEEVL